MSLGDAKHFILFYWLKKCHYIHTLFSPTINSTHLPVIWLWITMFLWRNTTNNTPTILSLIYIYTYSNINAKLKANCNSTWHLLIENSHRTSWRNTTLLHTLVHCCWRQITKALGICKLQTEGPLINSWQNTAPLHQLVQFECSHVTSQ